MNLVRDWRYILRKARSVKWAVASGVLSAIEVMVPFLDGVIPRGYFAMASLLAALAVPIARVAVQKNMPNADR